MKTDMPSTLEGYETIGREGKGGLPLRDMLCFRHRGADTDLQRAGQIVIN
jgi:hypothetical protein